MFNHQGSRSFGLTAVSDMAAAERHLAGHSIDVVLLGLERPDPAGLEAVRRIHAAIPRASIVLLCEPANEPAAVPAMQAGVQDHLFKDEVHELMRAEQLRALAERLEKAREEERVRVARDLHDDIGQILTAVKMDLVWIGKQLAGRNGWLLSRIDGAVELINNGVGSVREICARLRPSVLDDLGLAAAIEWQALEFSKRTGIACRLSLPANRLGLSGDQATTFFRIFQECLTNISRHANAQALEVSLKKENEDVAMVVKDDGCGFRVAERTSSLGILGMKERAQACGGELLIDSSPGKGTTVILRIPMPQPFNWGEPCAF
jgi:signal transduction histidine kinase